MQENPYPWTELTKVLPLAEMILSGCAATITGTTADKATQRARNIVEEATEWRTAHAKRVATALEHRNRLRALPLSDLLDQIGQDLRKDPASRSNIEAAEERLGITLPQEYKDLLLLSDGMEFIPSIYIPGLRSVKELTWEESEDLGLNELTVDLCS